MLRVTEIREFKILPCKIDKELIGSLGNILESDSVCQKEGTTYVLESTWRKIESGSCSEFMSADWPNTAKKISITVGRMYPHVISIQIDFGTTSSSMVNVSSTDATWADGMSKRIEEAFARKKLGYSALIEDFGSKVLVACLVWISLSMALTLLAGEVYFGKSIGAPLDTIFWQIFIGGGLPGILALYAILGWLFPRYDFGETVQKRLRKWILALLASSGLISIIIEWVFSHL